eukprot:2199789-Amphidinium_carterae.1
MPPIVSQCQITQSECEVQPSARRCGKVQEREGAKGSTTSGCGHTFPASLNSDACFLPKLAEQRRRSQRAQKLLTHSLIQGPHNGP